jgi:hypothetical protein
MATTTDTADGNVATGDQKPSFVVRGHIVKLSEGRSVFVGYSDNPESDDVFVSFTNEEGRETNIRLSEEAADALSSLLESRGTDAVARWVLNAPGTEDGSPVVSNTQNEEGVVHK